jgi:hypothetical protein
MPQLHDDDGKYSSYLLASCNDLESCDCHNDVYTASEGWGSVILGLSPTCSAISPQHVCVRFQYNETNTVDLCNCNPTWSTSDPDHDGSCKLQAKWVWQPVIWCAVALTAGYISVCSAKTTKAMLDRHKWKPNSANVTSFMATVAMALEFARHLTYTIRVSGGMGDADLRITQSILLGGVVVLLTTSFCTLAIAWIDIVKKSKKLKKVAGGEARNVTFHQGTIFLRCMIVFVVICTIFLSSIDRISMMSLVATFAQTILIPLMYIGGKRLNELLGAPKQGHVDLAGLINRTVRYFFYTWFANLIGAITFTYALAACYELPPTEQDGYTVLNFFAVLSLSCSSVFVGYALNRFFEDSQPRPVLRSQNTTIVGGTGAGRETRAQTDYYASEVEQQPNNMRPLSSKNPLAARQPSSGSGGGGSSKTSSSGFEPKTSSYWDRNDSTIAIPEDDAKQASFRKPEEPAAAAAPQVRRADEDESLDWGGEEGGRGADAAADAQL